MVRAIVRIKGNDLAINKDGGEEILYYKFENENHFLHAKNELKRVLGSNAVCGGGNGRVCQKIELSSLRTE